MKKRLFLMMLSLFSIITGIYGAEKIINISGKTPGWIGSGVCFEKGDKLTIFVKGSILHSSWDGEYHGPEGNPNSFCGSGCKPFTNKCNVASLVAKIGFSDIRCVGTAISGIVHNSGELKFGINDMPVSDNRGSFEVLIKGGHLCNNSKKNSW
jgi:hypothetical protein